MGLWRRLPCHVGGGRIRASDSSPSALKLRQPGPEMLSMTLWWITEGSVLTTLSPVAHTPQLLANTVADLISSLGIRFLGTGGASTERDQGKGIPGRIGLLDTGSQNQDQGCQLMQGLSRNPQDLLQEDPAKGHILKECQRCTQGPGPSLTPEEDLLQDQLHHLLQGKKQGIPGHQARLLSQVGKGRRLPGGIRSSTSPGLKTVDPGDPFILHQEGLKNQLQLDQN